MKNKHYKYLFLVILIALFTAQFFYLSPKGEFALNDDWVHTDTILHWVQTGQFRLMPFAGPTFYVPILYGTALIKIFGFSFMMLRISTLVLTLLLLSINYLLLNKLSNKPALAFFATLVLWSNPIFYNLSFTFMTDIPALLFLILSIYFYYSGFEKNKTNYLFWGTIFGLLSAFTRQTGILIVVAGTLYYLSQSFTFFRAKTRPDSIGTQTLVTSKKQKTGLFKTFIISFLLPLAIAGAVYTYLNIFQLTPQNTGSHIVEGTWRLIGHLKWWIFYIPMYLGLFTLPLTLGWFFKHHTEWFKKKNWLIILIIIGLTIFVRQIYHLQFPYIGNMFSYYGLGPMAGTLSGQLIPLIPSWGWGIVTLFSALGFSLLIMIFGRRHHNDEPIGFIYLFGLLYLIPILLFESFDRYLLPLLLVLIIALVQNIKHIKFSYFTSLILIVVFAFFSITQTKFYLNWNEARWQLANYATTLENDRTRIDAGYEWNGWNNYWPTLNNEKLKFTDQEIQTRPWFSRRFFPENNAEYTVSFSTLPNFEVIKQQKISNFNTNSSIYLLRRVNSKE